MKAIVMAGGEGTRLRPVTSGRPKPMVELLGKPVLSYTVELLKKYGVNDICFTLKYLPKTIQDYFGDGSGFGVKIVSRIEEIPMGTAGGVRACRDFIGDEDVLVMSGDAVCDFDLAACMDFHRRHGSDATLVLYEHPEPTEYGLVVTDNDGKIKNFVEKPRWDMVMTNLINTGIYILSPEAVEMIPEGKQYDFGKDLFPRMLREEKNLWGVSADGYWCDIGSPEAYRQCCLDVASGRTELKVDARESSPGVWAQGEIPKGVKFVPPVYIGSGCTIAPGSTLGPDTVVSGGSAIMRGAEITGSIINGSIISESAKIKNAVIGRGATVGEYSEINDGCIIGDYAQIGSRALVETGVRVWSGRAVPDGSVIKKSIIGEVQRERPSLGGGELCGEFVSSITPELAMAFGGVLGSLGRTGTSWYGGEAARLMAAALGCGVTGAGGEFYELDCSFEAELACAAKEFALNSAVFIRQDRTRITMSFFGEDGLELDGQLLRKLESASAGEYPRTNGLSVGGLYRISGADRAYLANISETVREYGIKKTDGDIRIAVTGNGAENRMLRRALDSMGAVVTEKRSGLPVFSVCQGGGSLQAWDEEGRELTSDRTLAITATAAMRLGEQKLAVGCDAPAAVERLALKYGVQVLRVSRDPDANQLLSKQTFMRDGVFAAVIISGAMLKEKVKLSELYNEVPRFTTVRRQIDVACSRAKAMRMLAADHAEMSAEFARGLSMETERGRTRISPSRDGRTLIISGEAQTEEIAGELCGDIERLVRELRD